ncbi:MAG: EAL domain-containing response regulator [Gammaproteobacteria bacterium]
MVDKTKNSAGRPGPTNDPGGLRVLLVDDDPFILKLGSKLMIRAGVVEVRTAEGGEEALDLVRARSDAFDIVLTDINMPGIDGIAVLSGLADLGFQGGVGLLSGEDKRVLDSVHELGAARNLNVLGVLEKPLQVESVTKLFGRFQAGAAGTPNQDASRGAGAGAGGSEIDADELARALLDGEIEPYFQPIVAAHGGEVCGAEALARWHHPHHGLVMPGLFVPLAEQNGLAGELTRRILSRAIQECASWLRQGFKLSIAINVPLDAIGQIDLGTLTLELIEAAGIEPAQVILEITESQVMTDLVTPLEVLNRLRIRGVRLAIDDFGTGYSSMQQLKRVPFTELKVDRAFVFNAAEDDSARAMLESSARLGKSLNLDLVAEGVESQADWNTASAAGVDLIQGYYVARPMPAGDFAPWLKQWDPGRIESAG